MSSVRALVVGHAQFATALVTAVNVIAGQGDALRAISNEGLGAKELHDRIAAALDETGAKIVFADLPAGSCGIASRKLLRERPGLTLVAGVNLPMLLEFVSRAETTQEAVALAVARGREHVSVLTSDVG